MGGNTYFFLLLAGFALGFFLQERSIAFQICLIGFVYWLGIWSGEGAELERAILFAVTGIILILFTKGISFSFLPQISIYCFLSYVSIMLGMPALFFLKKRSPDSFLGLRDSFRKSITRKKEKHIHAISYSCIALLSIWIAQYFQIERGYWITVTALLVMRADRTQSLTITSQRLLGTALGVLLCDMAIPYVQDSRLFIFLVCLSAFIIPAALKKNYLLASFLITIFVVALLELAATKMGDTNMAFVRLRATLIGCAPSVLGALLSKILTALSSRILLKNSGV